MIISLADITMK